MRETLWQRNTMKEREILWKIVGERGRTSVVRKDREKERERERESEWETLWLFLWQRKWNSEREKEWENVSMSVLEKGFMCDTVWERDTQLLTHTDRLRLWECVCVWGRERDTER